MSREEENEGKIEQEEGQEGLALKKKLRKMKKLINRKTKKRDQEAKKGSLEDLKERIATKKRR